MGITYARVMNVMRKFNSSIAFSYTRMNLIMCRHISSLYQFNSTITSCFKGGDIEAARKVFDEMPHKNVVTWNCMISGYIRNEMISEAREVFDTMPSRNVVSWTAMVSGYAKCGRLEQARDLFDGIDNKNVVCWNAMITGYVRNGRMQEARELFDEMPVKNDVSWVIILEGYFLHGMVHKAEELLDQAPVKSVSLYNAMLSGYLEMGRLEALRELFSRMCDRDVDSWTTMITCLSRTGDMENARGLFEEMPEKDVVACNAIICGYLHNNQIEDARKLFDEMSHRDNVMWNSMIWGYVQNGRLEDALELFKHMPRPNIESWNSILQGYVRQGDVNNARKFIDQMRLKDETSWNIMIAGCQSDGIFILFSLMLQSGFKPDHETLTAVIPVCGALAAHVWGRSMHLYVIKVGFESDTVVISSLISMYGKCGFLNDAVLVFERTIDRDIVAWNAVIMAQASHGCAFEALNYFLLMIDAGFAPDYVTFLGILTACAHSGLVNEGWKYFKAMQNDWNLIPKPEHYACMVDLLGRSGLLAETYELVKQLPVDLPEYSWETLLSSCRADGNFGLGQFVAHKLVNSQPLSVGMCASSMYAAKGMWGANIRALLNHTEFKKEVSCSWIEIKGQVCQFLSNDKSHPQMEDIHIELENLSVILDDIG